SAQGDPADPVRSFYADVAAHDYAAGYALFSDDLKSRLPDEAAWAHRFDHTVTTHVPNSEVVYRDAILASVTLSHGDYVCNRRWPGDTPLRWYLAVALRA